MRNNERVKREGNRNEAKNIFIRLYIYPKRLYTYSACIYTNEPSYPVILNDNPNEYYLTYNLPLHI